jgi:hypothetical protein
MLLPCLCHITGKVNRCDGLVLGYGTRYFEHSFAPVGYANFLERMLNPCQRTAFPWVTARQTTVPKQPATSVSHFLAPVLPCPHAIASDIIRSARRNPDKPPSNQTTEYTEEHRGIASQNLLRILLCTLCPLWFSPSLNERSTSNRASQSLQVFARTGLSDPRAPSSTPITLDECRTCASVIRSPG